MFIFSKAFAAALVERAVKTAAQSALIAFGASDAGPVDLFVLDFATVGGFALGGFVVSALTSIAVGGVSGTGPSIAPQAEAAAAGGR